MNQSIEFSTVVAFIVGTLARASHNTVSTSTANFRQHTRNDTRLFLPGVQASVYSLFLSSHNNNNDTIDQATKIMGHPMPLISGHRLFGGRLHSVIRISQQSTRNVCSPTGRFPQSKTTTSTSFES
jgi:hypothetical protein